MESCFFTTRRSLALRVITSPPSLLFAFLVAFWLPLIEAQTQTATAPFPSANEILQPILERQVSSGTKLRAKIESTSADGSNKNLQVSIQTRNDSDLSQTLVFVLYPPERKGEAVSVIRSKRSSSAPGRLDGFTFRPPNEVKQLGKKIILEPLFGTPLSLEDVVESFWTWPHQRVVAQQSFADEAAWIVESRESSPKGAPLVRSTISLDKKIPLLIERFEGKGQLVSKITFDRVVRRDGNWVPTSYFIEWPATKESVRITFSRSERDLVLDPKLFTPEGIRSLVGGE